MSLKMSLTEIYSRLDAGETLLEDMSPMESILRKEYGSSYLIMSLDRIVDLPAEERQDAIKRLITELRELENDKPYY